MKLPVLRILGDGTLPLMNALLDLSLAPSNELDGLIEVIIASGEPITVTEIERLRPPYLKAANDISQLLQNHGFEEASKFLDCKYEL